MTTAPSVALHPCPYGCGAQLGVSSLIQDGERGQCGQCHRPTVYQGGRLQRPTDLAVILQHGTRDAMTPAQMETAVARQVASSQRLAGEDNTAEDVVQVLRSARP